MKRLPRLKRLSLALAALPVLSACSLLQPALPQAKPDVAEAWPALTLKMAELPAAQTPAGADLPWQDFFRDEALKTLIARALENNRDLKVAVLNVERVRAQYRIQRADRLPTLSASGAGVHSGGDRPLATARHAYTAELDIGFEVDLFGRVHNLSEAALEQYLATEEAHKSAHIALIAEVANAWLALAADREMQRIAQATEANHRAVYDLAVRRQELGAASALETQQARTAVESARADAARLEGQVARDINALTLLAGAPVEAALLPAAMTSDISGLATLPAGLPSQVLLRRPDVQQAEHRLRSANANIGAARAAFFPSITLTAAYGASSTELSGLFHGGSFGWNFLPRITLPIFDTGRLLARLDVAQADRDIALAQYEKAIQSGFREVADALATSSALAEQQAAQRALQQAAEQAFKLSEARYKAGQDSYLTLLDAQRTLYNARQGLVAVESAVQANRIALYRALGGGWLEKASGETEEKTAAAAEPPPETPVETRNPPGGKP